jgi:hypothetical protein
VLRDVEPAVEIALEPVDSIAVTTLMDNVTDMVMPDQGPAPARRDVGRPQAPVGGDGGGRGAPDHRVRAGLSAPAGLARRALASRPAGPRRSGPDHDGWRAQHAKSARPPAAFIPNTVGSSFYL